MQEVTESCNKNMAPGQEGNVTNCIIDGIRKNYNLKKYADVVIKVDTSSFYCHRIVLSAVSEYFDAMFSSSMKEAQEMQVDLRHVRPEIFEKVLSYIYNGEDIVTPDSVEEFLQVASMFRIHCLQDKCEQFMLQNIDLENCLGVWKLAKSHNCYQLIQTSQPYIMEHFENIWESDEFLELDKDDILSILQDENLCITMEENVCKALMRWVEANECRRKQALPELFQQVRMASVNLDYLLDELDQHPLILRNKKCTELVKNAIKYHALPARRQTFAHQTKDFRRNGTREQVLTILGCHITENLSTSVEFIGYSFAQKRWLSMEKLPNNVGEYFAVCSYGDDIFLTGGTTNLHLCLRYSAKFAQWQEKSGLKNGRYRHATVALRDSIFVIGGYNFGNLKSVEEYNMGADCWKHVGELHLGVDATSASTLGDKIYIFGGWSGCSREVSAIQCFDTRTYTCTKIADLPNPCKFTRSLPLDDRIVVVSSIGEIMSFTADGQLRVTNTIKDFSRKNFGLFLYNGKICLIGGEQIDNNDTDNNKLCSDILVIGDDQAIPNEMTHLPIPVEVFGCLRSVLWKKYPLTDCESMIRDFGGN